MKSPERMRAKRYEIAAIRVLNRHSARPALTACRDPVCVIGAVAPVSPAAAFARERDTPAGYPSAPAARPVASPGAVRLRAGIGHRPRIADPGAPALPAELDHDLDVVLLARERLVPAVELDAAGDEALEPDVVSLRERLRRGLVVAAVRVDGAE